MSGLHKTFWISAVVFAFVAGLAGGIYAPSLWHGASRVPVPNLPTGSMAYYDVGKGDDGGVDHFAGVRTNLHRTGLVEGLPNYVALKIIVAPDGQVISATPVSGIQTYYADAAALALTWKLKPFMRNGHPVYARLAEVGVGISPPERWRDYPVAFPPVRDFSSVTISLVRTPCFGSCPIYRVAVHGDGSVEYDGQGYVAVQGKHRAKVPVAVVRDLVEAFRRARFFSLLPNYWAQITDNPSQTITISFDGRSTQVVDYAGEMVGMPDAVTELENEIDRALDVARWSKGTDDTVPSLLAEHWDFKADTCANTALVAGAARHASANLVRSLLEQGAPVAVHCRPDEPSDAPAALVSAAERQDGDMMDMLLGAGAGGRRGDVRAAAIAAAKTGSLDSTLRLGMYLNNDFKFADPDGETVLMAAADSCAPMIVLNLTVTMKTDVNAADRQGKTALLHAVSAYGAKRTNAKADCAETVRLLIAGGAKVNVRDRCLVDTPLTANAFDPVIAKHLLKAGADINAQNKAGDTALMASWTAELTRVLLAAGADPWIVNKVGRNALDEARVRFSNPQPSGPARVLEAWMKAHPKPKK